MNRTWVAALAALVLAGCDGATEPDWDIFLEGANQAEAQWRSAGPDHYAITQLRDCVCTADERGPVRIEVNRSGTSETVVSMTYTDGGLPVPPIYREHFLTVSGLFELIRDAARAKVAGLQVSYDTPLGYPRRVQVDWSANAFEDDVVYTVTALEAL